MSVDHLHAQGGAMLPLGVCPQEGGMAVDVEPWPEEAVEEEESGGPPVGEVPSCRGPRGWGVGQEDVHPMPPPKPPREGYGEGFQG